MLGIYGKEKLQIKHSELLIYSEFGALTFLEMVHSKGKERNMEIHETEFY